MVYNKYMKEIIGNSGRIINNTVRIENFYPEIYNNILILVKEKIKNSNLKLNNISKKELEKIANEIYFKIDNPNANRSFNIRKYTPQIRNIALRDLIWIVLVQEIVKPKNLDFFESTKKIYNSNSNIYEK